jgi:hypothetical protein
VTLKDSPGKAIIEGEADTRPVYEGQGIGIKGNYCQSKGQAPGVGGEEIMDRQFYPRALCLRQDHSDHFTNQILLKHIKQLLLLMCCEYVPV